MNKETYPRLILPDWFDDRCEYETPLRGVLEHAEVELENGNRYQSYFITPTRLRQELEELIKWDKPYYAEVGIIILPEVTIEKVREALKMVEKEGFFEKMKPINIVCNS